MSQLEKKMPEKLKKAETKRTSRVQPSYWKKAYSLAQGFIQAFSLCTVFVLKIQFYERGSVAREQVINSWGPRGAVSPLVGVKGTKLPENLHFLTSKYFQIAFPSSSGMSLQ